MERDAALSAARGPTRSLPWQHDETGPGRLPGSRGRRTTGAVVKGPRSRREWRIGPLLTAVALAGFAGLGAPMLVRLPLRGGAFQPMTGLDAWLLAVFTAGVLALLLAAAVAVGGGVPGHAARRGLARRFGRGDPEGQGATEASAPDDEGAADHARVARWVAEMGGWLLLVYMGGWIATR